MLLEQQDFCGSNWLRVLHGGLRYLQTLDVHRFRELVAERRWFLRSFPDLVKPLACLMPLYGFGLKRPSMFRMAFLADAALGPRRSSGVPPSHRLPAGRVLGVEDSIRLFSGIDREGCSAELSGTTRSHPARRA